MEIAKYRFGHLHTQSSQSINLDPAGTCSGRAPKGKYHAITSVLRGRRFGPSEYPQTSGSIHGQKIQPALPFSGGDAHASCICETNAQQSERVGGQSPLCISAVSSSGGGFCPKAALSAVQQTALTNVSPIPLSTIQFDSSTLKASLESSGLYNLIGLGTWNGQPVSPTNMPDHDQRLLVADINLYVLPSAATFFTCK